MNTVLMNVTVLGLLGVLASVAQASDFTPSEENYHYGMALDVAEVISITEQPGGKNQISQVQMLYLDHNDQVRCVTYEKQRTNEHTEN